MGFLQWLGISARDAPKVNDSVRDSGQTFVFGKSDAGETVNEKSAMQIATVYACVRLLAESVAQLPLHLYRYTDGGIGKEIMVDINVGMLQPEMIILAKNANEDQQPAFEHYLNYRFSPDAWEFAFSQPNTPPSVCITYFSLDFSKSGKWPDAEHDLSDDLLFCDASDGCISGVYRDIPVVSHYEYP